MSSTASLRPSLAGARGDLPAGVRGWGARRVDLGSYGPTVVSVISRSRREEGSSLPASSPVPAAVMSDAVGFVSGAAEPASNFDPEALEVIIEKAVYRCRFFSLLGVLGSLVGSVLCFFKGCVYITTAFLDYPTSRAKAMSSIIEAIDIYLIGTVMMIFGMGIYELFISNLDMAKKSSNRSNLLGLFTLQERPRWLEIKSVNELKTKLGHVIVMALLVGLFDKIQKVGIVTPVDLLCLTASILFSSGSLLLLSKLSHSKHK